MLVQLVYMSAATRPLDEIELSALLAKARTRNWELSVTGMLVYHEGSFLQVLEGRIEVVDTLYTRITSDARHMDCQLLSRTRLAGRTFGDWSMGFVNTQHPQFTRLPGFTKFFEQRFSTKEFVRDPSIAHNLLLAFREGKWRMKVEQPLRTPVMSTSH